MNILTYDFRSVADKFVSHHAPLYALATDQYESIEGDETQSTIVSIISQADLAHES